MAPDNSDHPSTPKRSKGYTRQVQFYQIVQRVPSGLPVPTAKLIKEALTQPTTADPIIETASGIVRVKDLSSPNDTVVKLALWLSRNDMCSRERKGKELSIGLDNESRLLEKAHAIYFEDKYLAFLFNHRCAHAEQIPNFLNANCGDRVGLLKIRPWVSQDTVNKIKSVRAVTLARFRLYKTHRVRSTQSFNPLKRLQDAFDDVEYEEFEVTMTGKNTRGRNFSDTVMPHIKKWAQAADANFIFDSLFVRGKDEYGSKQEVDLKKDRLLTRIGGFTYNSDGTVNDTSAFEKLTKVYELMRPELQNASVFEEMELQNRD